MSLLAVGFLQLLVATTNSAPRSASQLDSVATERTIYAAERRFIDQWRIEWLRSDWYRWVADGHGSATLPSQLPSHRYSVDLECGRSKVEQRAAEKSDTGTRNDHFQRSAASVACPSWTNGGPFVPDASVVLDSALTPVRRIRMANARDSLIELVGEASRAFPGNPFFIMQHLRLLLDQSYRSPKYLQRAAVVADGCEINRDFCNSLRGLVYARRGLFDSAQMVFAEYQKAVVQSDACYQDNSLGLMPARESQTWFGDSPDCKQRVQAVERFWWLADPLWSDSLNERRVEHDMRNMWRILTGGFAKSERIDWMRSTKYEDLYNAELYATMISKYGWPSQMFWPSVEQQREVSSDESMERGKFRPGIDPISSIQSPPTTTFVYTNGRTHTAPSWDALTSPFTARNSDWHLDAGTNIEGKAAWPSEHFKRERPLYDITDFQLQVWRRRDSMQVAIAAQWPAFSAREFTGRGAYDAVLMRSTGVGEIAHVASAKGSTDRATVLAATLPADSSLLSLELRGRNALRRDARVRFALMPETPLSRMENGDVEASLPLFARAQTQRSFIANATEATSRMYPTLTIRDKRFALYWELYGFTDRDTIATTVHIERVVNGRKMVNVRVSRPGVSSQMRGKQFKWRDLPRTDASSAEFDALTFATSPKERSVVVDASSLATGKYVVTVSSRAQDGRAAVVWREFSIK